jgi:hypothetical protein
MAHRPISLDSALAFGANLSQVGTTPALYGAAAEHSMDAIDDIMKLFKLDSLIVSRPAPVGLD